MCGELARGRYWCLRVRPPTGDSKGGARGNDGDTRTRTEGAGSAPLPGQREERATKGLLNMNIVLCAIKFHMEDISLLRREGITAVSKVSHRPHLLGTDCHVLAVCPSDAIPVSREIASIGVFDTGPAIDGECRTLPWAPAAFSFSIRSVALVDSPPFPSFQQRCLEIGRAHV